MTDHEDDITTAFMESVLMDEMHNYVRRGRRFENIATARLNEQWAAAFRRFVRDAMKSFGWNRANQHDTRELDDTTAELRLRELDPPIETVKREVGTLQWLVSALGPEIEPSINEEMDQFITDQKRLN